MPAKDDWAKLEKDYNDMYADPVYAPLRPLIANILPQINTRENAPPESLLASQILIAALRGFREKQETGPQGIDGIREIAHGITQNFQADGGNILSARNIVFAWIKESEKDIKLPE